jgi:hypothetical protein
MQTRPRGLRFEQAASSLRASAANRLTNRRFWIGLGLSTAAVASLVVWVALLQTADVRQIDDRGLISVIPPPAFLSIGLLSMSFVLALRMRPHITPVLVIHVIALVFVLYGAPAYVEELPRFATAWLHVGFSEAIARTGELFPFRDARFDWPAFFAVAAFITAATGFDDLIQVLPWVPPLVMLLYLGPLYMILRAATADRRLIWFAIWFFYLVNWVGQDYFSPQAFNLLLLLAVLAVLLTWFRRSGSAGSTGGGTSSARLRLRSLLAAILVDPAGSIEAVRAGRSISVRQQIGLIAIVAAMFGTSVASHQLTPFALVGGVIGLTIFNRIRLTGLAMFMVVLLSLWLMFMATTFLSGHLASLLEQIFRPENIDSTLARLVGSRGHLFVLQARLVLTLGVWVLALIGGLRRLRSGQLDLTLAVLAIAPFGLILLQAYGGEMLLRVYLFSGPFMAFFAAAAFFPTMRPGTWRTFGALGLLSITLASVMLLTRYGNEKADYVTAAEYRVMQYVASVAQPGDTIGSANHSVPLGYIEWEQHRHVGLDSEWRFGDMDLVVLELTRRTPEANDSYLIITRGQRAYAELFWNMSDARWDHRVEAMAQRAELLFANADGAVYRVPPPAEPAEPDR